MVRQHVARFGCGYDFSDDHNSCNELRFVKTSFQNAQAAHERHARSRYVPRLPFDDGSVLCFEGN